MIKFAFKSFICITLENPFLKQENTYICGRATVHFLIRQQFHFHSKTLKLLKGFSGILGQIFISLFRRTKPIFQAVTLRSKFKVRDFTHRICFSSIQQSERNVCQNLRVTCVYRECIVRILIVRTSCPIVYRITYRIAHGETYNVHKIIYDTQLTIHDLRCTRDVYKKC